MRYKIKYLILIFSFGLIFYSCKNDKANQEFIERLSSIENGLPSPYFNYYLYFKIDDDKFIETNITFLYKIYQDHYVETYKNNFNAFLTDLFTQNKPLKIEDIDMYKNKGYFFNVYNIDKKISNMNIENIKKKYLKSEQNSFILIPKELPSMSSLKTVLYEMFSNGYIITMNDYGGGYYSIEKYESK
ncbi:hypothetical protein DBR39_00160 [Chryseobacterium sp. KBW03]|uniref:hypothetical protein n=1 Tax=Chryseobacterium sp. KBW03 TaxID=2153362 RepID=UPI000F597568|nr:hypothetical protein [Chryseobacterium sp. KBW03]RQO42325.1 hypothetical protein DBR39_00160 [Chryseobacterium sp. KBW03]